MASFLALNVKPIDWTLCCLCQTKKAQRPQNATEKGLQTLEKDLKDLELIEALPFGIDIHRLDEGSGLLSTLISHNAVYHKLCRDYCNSNRVKRARKKYNVEDDDTETDCCGPKKLRSSNPTLPVKQVCVVCEETSGELHKVRSMDAGENLKEWAEKTKNFPLLARLVTTASDAHAADIYYHTVCYTELRYAASKEYCSATSTGVSPVFDPMVTAQLVSYMSESGKVFKRTHLESLYKEKLEELGHPCPQINPTRFKDHLLKNLPNGWYSFSKGRDVYLSHSNTVGDALAQSLDQSDINQDDALLLMKASTILRRHILMKQSPFEGSFPSDSLTGAVPESLLSFMVALLQGPRANLEGLDRSQDNAGMHQRSKVASGLCQLIIYNTVKYSSSESSVHIRHSKDHETPLPLYIGIKMHSSARHKHLVDTLHQMGLCVSYERIREVKVAVARSVCKQIEEDGVVLPSNMRFGVFTSGDMDNLDHKKTSNLSNHEFHGTAITLTNHLSRENMGVARVAIKIDSKDLSKPTLPDNYVMVPPVDLRHEDLFVPRTPTDGDVRPSHDRIPGSRIRDGAWVKHVSDHLSQEVLEKGAVVTWSGFHSRLQEVDSVKPPAEIGILPLFPDKSTDPGMVKHAMLIVQRSTEFLNPGQTPVLGADQPLYAVAKQLQWQFPSILGENLYVMMMGALHIEDKAQLMLGKFIRGSGWEWAMNRAEVFTAGRAASTLDDHHIKRSRYAHQVSLVALSLLKQECYSIYCDAVLGPPESFEQWSKKRREDNGMFKYWSTIIELQQLICRFVRSIREGDFDLYVQVLDELCPWFFVFDHVNYARWLPIHVRDLVALPIDHPSVYDEFKKGNFVVQRSHRKFSLIAKDQSHEQSNKKLQAGGGGLSDLYDDAGAIALYMLAGPDSVRLIDQFESALTTPDSSIAHHEESPALQQRFINDVKRFVGVLKECGNPFLETGPDLITLDTHEVMDTEVAKSLCTLDQIGQALHASYVQSRVQKSSIPITDTIKRNSVYTFANRPDVRSRRGDRMDVLKKDTTLVTRLFLSLQSRPDADMSDFFRFENQREPPSLADHGRLRQGTKSDILKCLGVSETATSVASDVSVIVLDMPAIVHMVRPTSAATFSDYVSMHLVPFLRSKLTPSVKRVDAVWDVYPDDSLKQQTHSRRGFGPRTRISEDGRTLIPKRDWNKYLSNIENKKEFFSFCSRKLSETNFDGILLFTTVSTGVLSNKPSTDISGLEQCNHTEADSRMILHLAHASRQGHEIAYMRTVDSDVVVLAVAFFEQLNMPKLWVGFGTSRNYKAIPIHDLHSTLGPSRSRALLLFHPLTGCDTTSQLLGIGKKSAWAAWESMPEMTDTFLELLETPEAVTVGSSSMKHLERFYIIMYNKSSSASTVDQARKQLFTSGSRSLEALPPTQAALFQHVKRSLLQGCGCYIWKQADKCAQQIPSFSEWGWEQDEVTHQWVPFWTALPDASSACSLLLRCGCQKACRGLCKCSKAGVRCTSLCKCEGGCVNNE